MIRCLDIHTHHPAPRPEAVVCAIPSEFNPCEGQFYSLGIHPWDTSREPSPEEWQLFERLASLPCVKAVGECGIDKLKGAPLFRQMIIFKKQIDISEKLGKPLIIHDVKAHDIIVGLKRDLNPTQKWLVHGFRNKPSVAKMLTDAGIFLSFGEIFNDESLKCVPRDMILAETDESRLSIEEIISRLSLAYGTDLLDTILQNTSGFLNLPQINLSEYYDTNI